MKPRRIILAGLILLGTVHAVLSNIVANFLQSKADTKAKYVVVSFVIITVILLLWELWERSQQSDGNRSDDLASRNRRAMIEKVRVIWITGVLNESLYKETLITLGLAKRSDTVERPMDLLMQRPDKADQHLPPGARIIDVYDELGGALLLLGAPGSGKTTLLLELTRNLLERAERDKYLYKNIFMHYHRFGHDDILSPLSMYGHGFTSLSAQGGTPYPCDAYKM